VSYKKAVKGKSITFRPKKDLRERLEILSKATERPISYFIEKSIEAHLPALEEKHAVEIESENKIVHYELNDRGKKKTG